VWWLRSYQNCLFHREFEGALESLHRYFDYGVEHVQRAHTQKSQLVEKYQDKKHQPNLDKVSVYLSFFLFVCHFVFSSFVVSFFFSVSFSVWSTACVGCLLSR
jgi:hypothetical protein